MEDTLPAFWIGHHQERQRSCFPLAVVQDAHTAGYDMVTSPITTAIFHSRVLALLSSIQTDNASSDGDTRSPGSRRQYPLIVPPLSPVDTDLTPDDSISQIIATTSPWIDLCSPDPLVADVSKQILMSEIAYAAFCGVSYVLIAGPRLPYQARQQVGLMQYARTIQEILTLGPYMQIKIWFPMIDHPENDTVRMGDLAPFARPEFTEDDLENTNRDLDLYGTWDAWNMIRSFCKYHARLCVALMLPKHLPPVTIQKRWFSEPVRLLTIDATSFSENTKGYPVLSKPHQVLINSYMRLRTLPWLLLCNIGCLPGASQSSAGSDPSSEQAKPLTVPVASSGFPTPAEAAQRSFLQGDGLTAHLLYMRNLQNKQSPQSPFERFGNGYQDYLQAPLQPLTVNLESITYEVFEKDPVKYDWYEKAIARALHDWMEQGKPTSNPDGRVVVAVVGAGRGPLVTRALKASDDVGVDIDVWVLEKNPNAFVLLQRHNADPDKWANRVNLVKSDMRTWKGPWRRRENEKTGIVGQTISPGPSPSANEVQPEEATSTHLLVEQYPIDILISELLGSFADNELSPECLDGVKHLLNPVHGISIPASYTAHLTPIAAPKLHADIKAQAQSNQNAFETPYVVMLHAFDYLSTHPASHENIEDDPNSARRHQQLPSPFRSSLNPLIQQAWSFTHPDHGPYTSRQGYTSHTNPNRWLASAMSPSNAHNARHSSLSFPVRNRGTCHGLAGYFEAVLYGSVELSTNPATMDRKSEGMISWFPIFFPLKTPIYAPSNSELVVDMWRQTDDRKVWYEWIVEVFALSNSEQSPSLPYDPSTPFPSKVEQERQQNAKVEPNMNEKQNVETEKPKLKSKSKSKSRWRFKDRDQQKSMTSETPAPAAPRVVESPDDIGPSTNANNNDTEAEYYKTADGGDDDDEDTNKVKMTTRPKERTKQNRMRRIAMTELHSSIGEACLM